LKAFWKINGKAFVTELLQLPSCIIFAIARYIGFVEQVTITLPHARVQHAYYTRTVQKQTSEHANSQTTSSRRCLRRFTASTFSFTPVRSYVRHVLAAPHIQQEVKNNRRKHSNDDAATLIQLAVDVLVKRHAVSSRTDDSIQF